MGDIETGEGMRVTRQPPELVERKGEYKWVTDLVRAAPQAPLMAPFMVYLLLLLLDDVFPPPWIAVSWVIRAGVAAWTAWIFRKHYPPFGKAHWGWAIPVGPFAAWGWVYGQRFFDALGLGGVLSPMSLFSDTPSLLAEPPAPFLARELITSDTAFWTHVMVKLGYSSTVVPLVEELFWRAFLLRALIHWDHFDEVPLGKFALFSFFGTALLSTFEHPANWGVSILCWLLYNGLFCWKRSILCLIVTHGITNLALYAYVVYSGDWRFW